MERFWSVEKPKNHLLPRHYFILEMHFFVTITRSTPVKYLRINQRHSFRLKDYDYSQSGFYFVTICTQNKLHLFGKIKKGKMILNDLGRMVQSVWFDIHNRFLNVKLETFQIMPNHIHGIVVIDNIHNNKTIPQPTNNVGTPVGVRLPVGWNNIDTTGNRTGTRPVPTVMVVFVIAGCATVLAAVSFKKTN